MSLREEIIAVLNDYAKTELKYVTIDNLMYKLPQGTKRHTVQTHVTKIARAGLLGQGEPGKDRHRKYKLVKEKPAINDVYPEAEDNEISLEQIGEAVYTRLVTLSRKLSDSENKRRDLEIKLKDLTQDHSRVLKTINNSIKEKNIQIANLQARVGTGSKSKTVKLSDVLHINTKQK